MKAFLCELILSCLLAAPGAKPIDELTYGTALFAFYQEDYEQALVDVMVAEAQGRQGEDPVRFDLALGSFAFKQRMYVLASDTFDQVADEELTDIDRMRLAFHLARERYRSQDWQGMEQELARIDLGSNWRGRRHSYPEVSFMTAEAAIALGDLARADAALSSMEPGEAFLAYGLFNLGVAYRASGDLTAARETFTRLAEFPAKDRVSFDIVQRARLALAVIARQEKRPLQAEAVLDRLPGEGRYRDVALAAYAGLAMENGDYELAARIWLTIQRESRWNASAAAAQLGFPMSLEHLSSSSQALDQYRVAERVFENRLVSLEQFSSRVDDRAWVRNLLETLADTASDTTLASEAEDADRDAALRSDSAVSAWREQLGRDDWLQWLASEDVHQVLLEWRELNGMAGWLGTLPVRLEALDEVAMERRRRTAVAREMIHREDLLGRRASLEVDIDEAAQRLQSLKASPATFTEAWMHQLATEQELELLQELSDLSDGARMAQAHMAPEDQDRFVKRVRRLEGTVFWQIADQRAGRLRMLDKALAEDRQLLADVDERIARITGAEASFAAGVETDFLILAERTETLRSQVTSALNSREDMLAAALRRGMQQEAREVEGYLATARIAIARATDQLAAVDQPQPFGGGS